MRKLLVEKIGKKGIALRKKIAREQKVLLKETTLLSHGAGSYSVQIEKNGKVFDIC